MNRAPRCGARHVLRPALLLLGMTAAPLVLPAQGAVRGQVRIIDRPGAPPANLRDVVVFLEGASDAPANRAGLPVLARATVAMKQREFEPHVQIIGVGGSVAYPNQDPYSHNVFSNSSRGAFDLGLYRSGKTRAATFPAAGVYAVYCNIHARMVNYVVAVRTPYVTRVQANGTFVIERVPAGTWTLHVWHERAPEHIEAVHVSADGVAGLALALDGRGYVAKAHHNKFGQPYALTRADRY